jgi:hypothetical protein
LDASSHWTRGPWQKGAKDLASKKQEVVLRTKYDPTEADPPLTDLAFHREVGYVHCSSMKCTRITEPDKDPDLGCRGILRFRR